ncbi:MAG: outer rane biosis protein BamB [Gemmataceae bacterium]|nr:outer rane biosis protein BamB [Gemmataceae bacterium]
MTTTTSFPEPRPSHWRTAVLVSALLGGGIWVGMRWASRSEAETIPASLMVMGTMFGPLIGLGVFALWWAVLGPGRWWKRLAGLAGATLVAAGVVAASHPSFRFLVAMWGVPLSVAVTGLVAAMVPVARWRPVVGVVAAAAAVAPWVALQMDGVNGRFDLETSYRWTTSVADQAANQLADRATVVAADPAADLGPATEADWPGFRGAHRDGEVPPAAAGGWDGSAPREKWRNTTVGPAWSSFCAAGDFVYTQEQRGESESVVCYRADTGKEVWARGDPGKHTDFASGIGPRATPTYANGRVYTVGATGTVSCLKAATGEPVWTISLGERFEATKPVFGLSSSPLVVGDLVIVSPSSPAAPRLVAVAAATGETKWAAEPKGTDGYSSPQPATIGGTAQVLLFNEAGLFGHDPATGKELWHYDWKVAGNEPTAVQPLVLADGRVVIGGGNIGMGARCVAVRKEGDGWAAEEVWKTTRFTPKFNDVVRAGNHLYGLDNGGMVCLDLVNGKVVWKEGQYGSGQLLLVGNKLLVVSEKGHLACVRASPEGYDELWKVDAVEGKTWNHPVIARGRLFVRNATVAVGFDLPATRAGK